MRKQDLEEKQRNMIQLIEILIKNGLDFSYLNIEFEDEKRQVVTVPELEIKIEASKGGFVIFHDANLFKSSCKKVWIYRNTSETIERLKQELTYLKN